MPSAPDAASSEVPDGRDGANRLASESSPYLRQHRFNPVDWYPWGPEAFAAARDRGVPILLSVGYSACHWCHVMAHECFEDPEVARAMNAGFVNVKVDREERPDVDALYMDAVQALGGRGGWPMTVFTNADGEPFFGGTYYPKQQFLQLLQAITEALRDRPGEIEQNVAALRRALGATASLVPADDLPGTGQLNAAVQQLGRAFDREWGGFGSAPKFPSTFHLELMMRAYMSTGSELAREIVVTTLDAMASGGMYDHLAGGFARYSVDDRWLVPHFEKMLYDQALLVRTYLHGFMLFGNPSWKLVVEETIDDVLVTFRHRDGGFCSAVDADAPDEAGHPHEGRSTTWTPDEVATALADAGPELVAEVLRWYGIDGDGNFEGRSIPNRLAARGALLRPPRIETARRSLLAARRRRPQPALDDKVLTEWNGLMLASLAEAAAVFRRADWLDAAVANAEFLISRLRDANGRWRRSWHADGEPPARHAALAADHAALVDAFTRLAEASGRARWIDEAQAVAETMLTWFWDAEQGGLHTTADDAEPLLVRQKDLADDATPSANSTAAIALMRLAALTGERRYEHHADRILQLAAPLLDASPLRHSNMLIAVDLRRRGLTEIVIAGDRPDLVRVAHGVWRPDAVVAWGERHDSPLWEGRDDGRAYVCRDHVCRLPSDTPEQLLAELTGGATSDRRG